MDQEQLRHYYLELAEKLDELAATHKRLAEELRSKAANMDGAETTSSDLPKSEPNDGVDDWDWVHGVHPLTKHDPEEA